MLVGLLLFCATQVIAAGFSSTGNWIWTNEEITLAGSRAFRRDFCPPQGKTPFKANIYITAANQYTLYVNAEEIGSGSNFQAGGAFCVSLSTGCNTFAVAVTTTLFPNPGLLATMNIVYTDGTTDILVSNPGSWLSFTSVPAGFQEPGFNDSAWPAAIVQARYGSAPWGAISLPSPIVPTFSLADALWIWTSEIQVETPPVGSRAFRKDITLPSPASSVAVTITADDEYTLYVQGNPVGSGTSWLSGQLYVVDIQPPTSKISIAVNATNLGGPNAGLIATINAFANDGCGTVMSASSDGTWLTSTSFPSGWNAPNFADGGWQNAVVEGQYGVAPWGAGLPAPFIALHNVNNM